jgi:23S rRNA (cytidine1920-2'-O)/16S rRNA (cytidine1409-2'-O)-methyltransferase
MGRRLRLDVEMVRRGLVDSRTAAVELIDLKRVLVGGAVADKASRQVATGDPITVVGPPDRFVSRGGEKLEHALEHFGVDVTGWRVLDAGASTGGFTDCVLQRGAHEVVAVDVGHGQLHPRIRNDHRVVVHEGVNVRALESDVTDGLVDLVVVDVSFISLRTVLPALIGVLQPGGTLVALVKPQFEAGRIEVAKGRGVISDPAIHERVCSEVGQAMEEAGLQVRGWVTSPITGARGNREFLVHAVVPAAQPSGGPRP